MKNLSYVICEGTASNFEFVENTISFHLECHHNPDIRNPHLLEVEKIEKSIFVCQLPANSEIGKNIFKIAEDFDELKVTVMGSLRILNQGAVIIVSTLRYDKTIPCKNTILVGGKQV